MTAVLADVRTVIVVDWPSPDVPGGLARVGLRVYVKGGPGPDEYREYGSAGGAGAAPDHAELVYAYRPLGELPGLVALARAVGAGTIWTEWAAPLPPDAEDGARRLVESAGLGWMSGPGIVDAVRRARDGA